MGSVHSVFFVYNKCEFLSSIILYIILLIYNITNTCYVYIAHIDIFDPEIATIITYYRSGTVNSNTVNSKFHLIRSFSEIFARFLSFHV